jgi:hypothetical protein
MLIIKPTHYRVLSQFDSWDLCGDSFASTSSGIILLLFLRAVICYFSTKAMALTAFASSDSWRNLDEEEDSEQRNDCG